MFRRRRLVLTAGALVVAASTARAHGAALRGSAESLSIPTWLFLATGGGVVGASFLLATFATDRRFVRRSHDWRRRLAVVPEVVRQYLAPAVGLGGLVVVLAF